MYSSAVANPGSSSSWRFYRTLQGMGDALDVAKTNAMKVGATGKVPALAHHYAVARGATVVAVTAMGPFAMTYVHPADDPRTAPHP